MKDEPMNEESTKKEPINEEPMKEAKHGIATQSQNFQLPKADGRYEIRIVGLNDKKDSNGKRIWVERYSKTFVERFKLARKKKGLTQKEIAAKTGLSVNTLTNYAKGEIPTLGNLIILADTLKVSIDYLLGRSVSTPNEITLGTVVRHIVEHIPMKDAHLEVGEKVSIEIDNELLRSFFKQLDQMLQMRSISTDEVYKGIFNPWYRSQIDVLDQIPLE